MKHLRSLIVVVAITGLAACGDSNNPTTTPVTLPATLPSSIAATVGQQVCDIRDQLLAVVGQIQGATPPSPGDVAARLQDFQSQLESQAGTLDSQGATQLADQVRALATAVGQLSTAVSGADPTALVTASAAVAAGLSQIPGCPSPSPTTSP
jgi:X-X-X-Leu-X-X-Gly heptad repeat protein